MLTKRDYFVPHIKIDVIGVNQKELYPDREATEDTDSFDENLPPLMDNAKQNRLEEETAETIRGNETPTSFDGYVPEVVA